MIGRRGGSKLKQTLPDAIAEVDSHRCDPPDFLKCDGCALWLELDYWRNMSDDEKATYLNEFVERRGTETRLKPWETAWLILRMTRKIQPEAYFEVARMFNGKVAA